MKHQTPSGWFGISSLEEETNDEPLIHFLVYTIRGILESGIILSLPTWIDSARCAADGFLAAQKRDATIFARYDQHWQPTVTWKCVTAIAQLSIVYMRLFQLDGQDKWFQAAENNLAFLLTLTGAGQPEIEGALGGSEPIDGPYMENSYLSWATKFLLEAIILCDELDAQK